MGYTPERKKSSFVRKAHRLYLQERAEKREGLKQVKIRVQEVDLNGTPKLPNPNQLPTPDSSDDVPLETVPPFPTEAYLPGSVSEPRNSTPQPIEVKLDPLILVHIDAYQFEGITPEVEADFAYTDLKNFFRPFLGEVLMYPNYNNLFIKFGKKEVVGAGNNIMETITGASADISGALVKDNTNRWGTGTIFNSRWGIQELLRAYYETININDVYENWFKKLNSIIIIYSANSSFRTNEVIDELEKTLNKKKFLLSSAQGFGAGDPDENLEAAVYKTKAPIEDIKFLYLIEVTDQDDHIKPATSGETSNFQWRLEHHKINSPMKLILPVNGIIHRHDRLETELSNSNLLVTQTLS